MTDSANFSAATFPVAPLNSVSSFYTGNLGSTLTGNTFSILGSNYTYNPADGNLVMHVVVTNQDNVPNNASNGYFWADYTNADVVRAFNGEGAIGGALVTEFSQSSAVPEPTAWAMMFAGFGMFGVSLRRREKIPSLA